MKFTLSWLKEYLETDKSLNEILETLTAIGLEVEEVTNFSDSLAPFTVAEILETSKHPEADKLQLCKVNTGSTILDIVCGAPNARAGIKVPLAVEGTIIPTNGMKIKKSKIRGVESNGMLCSGSELGITEDSDGILELPESAEVGKEFAQYLGLDDVLIEVAITPNRGDCLGVYGIARDLAAAGMGNLIQPQIPVIKDTNSFENSPISISIDAENSCSYFVGVHIKDVNNTKSPAWLTQKLSSIGAKTISPLVDITNYLTFAFGRPAHVYDSDKLNGNLSVRYAKTGEKIMGLDEKEYELNDKILVIADEKSPVAVAGVIGGLYSACTAETKNVYLEIANFDQIAVANSGRALQIDTDSRYRFERAIDPNSYIYFKTAISLIKEICGGEMTEGTVAGSTDFINRTLDFDSSIIEKVTGMKPEQDELNSLLEKLGFEIEGSTLTIPSWRNDIEYPEDITEEYARLKGYDNIPTNYLKKPVEAVPALDGNKKRIFQARRVLASLGLKEAITFSFMAENKAKLFAEGKELIELANPISVDLSVMRTSILPNLLDAVSSNTARGVKSFSLFEIGSIFSKNISSEKSFSQSQSIAAIRSGIAIEKTAISDAVEFDLFKVKEDLLEALSLYLDSSKLAAEQNDSISYFHPGRSGVFKLGKNIIAVFGEVHPTILKKFGIKKRVSAFEIFVDNLPKVKEKNKNNYSRPVYSVSNFQSIERDFAFILDKSKTAQDVIGAIKKSEKSITEGSIEDVRIFDIYEGDKIGEGKKSIAFSVKIQPKNDTFSDKQIEEYSNSIINSVSSITGGVLREA